MFFGTHRPRLDDKGRLFLPAKHREQLAEGVVMTAGQDHCIFVWPRAVFEQRAEEVARATGDPAKVRHFSRMFFATAVDDELDRQGRLTVPSSLRSYAGLDREVVVNGHRDRLEIWNAGTWEQYELEAMPVFAEHSEVVVPHLM
jgi:MraZ protein